MEAKTFAAALKSECKKLIIGKDEYIDKVIMAILARGNILFEDLPGCGKTTLAKAISLALGLDFKRIQFVSDMLPSDILGSNVFNQRTSEFEFKEGPIMTNIVLADEINRALPRTQSALLEAMEERTISIDGVQRKLPSPFLLIATENPIDSDSTFPLPSAAMDRFLISISLGYPDIDSEVKMLQTDGVKAPFDEIKRICTADELLRLQMEADEVHTSKTIERYIVSIAARTRKDERIKAGGSPRASRSLYQASKAWALMNGRAYVIPEDVVAISEEVLSHRIILSESAYYSGAKPSDIIKDILKDTPLDEICDLEDER